MPKRVRQPCRSQMYTKRISENRQMSLHDIAHDLEIDAEIWLFLPEVGVSEPAADEQHA